MGSCVVLFWRLGILLTQGNGMNLRAYELCAYISVHLQLGELCSGWDLQSRRRRKRRWRRCRRWRRWRRRWRSWRRWRRWR